MLETQENVAELLRCPKCNAKLTHIEPDGLVCSCDPSAKYAFFKNIPVLVDFHNSVFDERMVTAPKLERPVSRPRDTGVRLILKRLVSPIKKTTKVNVSRLIEELICAGSHRILVIGGAVVGQGMMPLYDHRDLKVIGLDIYYSPQVHFIADAHAIPLAPETVDAVIAQAVLEHVLEPTRVVAEIYRVLKRNGLVYAETPFMQQVHEGPCDFTRFTQSGHRYLFRRFKMLAAGVSGGPGTQLLWSIEYFARSLFRSSVVGKATKLAFFWLRYFDRFISAPYASDGASGVFFLGRKSGVELTPRDIIELYCGAQKS